MAKTLADLIAEAERQPEPVKLLSVRLPVEMIDRMDALAVKLRCMEGDLVTALLMEGLGGTRPKRRRKRA